MTSLRPVLVLLVAAVALSGGVGAIDAGVLDADVTGPAAATTADGVQYVWAEESPALQVQVAAPAFEEGEDYRHFDVHVTETRIEHVGPAHEALATESVVLRPLGDEQLTLELDREALSERGPATVFVGVYADTGALIDGRTVEVAVIRTTGDADDDGLRNGREIAGETDFLDPDTDDDDIQDGLEVTEFGTDPTRPDSDGEVADPIEVRHGTDPWAIDSDGDGLSDAREIEDLPTDPTRADTDGDGVPDGRELELGTDPTVPDTDGDGLTDGHELEIGTAPNASDTDGDGVPDDWELERYETDPTDPDSDGDGVTDGQEVGQPPATTGASGSLQQSIGGIGTALEGGLLAPFVAIAGTLAARRVLGWATYP